MRQRLPALVATLLASSLLAGCGTMRSYQTELNTTMASASKGHVDVALQQLESNNSGGNPDLLYYLEKGELLHLKSELPASQEAWFQADEKVRIWENEYRANPGKVLGNIGSYLVNDKTRRYDGYDYEKVMLNTFMTLNHAVMGRYDLARPEIKKTHEREALIADYHAKEIAKTEDSAKEHNIKTTYKELRGYPVETLDAPEVVGLKNSYQSAFSHYLAGYIYEALNEPSLAAPGYRKAIELRPDIKMLEEGLNGLGKRSRTLKTNQSDVLFVLETGSTPARKSVSIPVPVTVKGTFVLTPISFPVIQSAPAVYVPGTIEIGGQPVQISSITNLDAMSRRALRDDMPGIIVRSVVRAAVKGAMQKEVNDRAGPLGGLLVSIASVVTEQADERTWRSLPAQIAIGRATLNQGTHTVRILTPQGERLLNVKVAGKHTIVPIRIFDQAVYVSQQLPNNQFAAATQPN